MTIAGASKTCLFASWVLSGTCVLGSAALAWGLRYQIGLEAFGTLATRFERTNLDDSSRLIGVIALGGNNERVREAGRLARRHPHLAVFISGAGDRSHVLSVLGAGIDPDRVTTENASNNTYDNARFTADFVRPKVGQRWLLVTSSQHMPRAVGAFRRQGFLVETWPVDDADLSNSAKTTIAQREWIGLFSYWARGRSTSPFPGPS